MKTNITLSLIIVSLLSNCAELGQVSGLTEGQQLAGLAMAGAGVGAAANSNYGLAQSFLNTASTTLAGGVNSAYMKAGKSNAQDIIGNVTLGSAEMTQYTDGKAYDVLTLLPTSTRSGSSGGEWCYQYGIPIGNACSLLSTGYALAGESSAYGGGNPRQTISWRSYSVRKGQTIKMGIQWKKGVGAAAQTPYVNRYTNSRPL